MSDEERRASVRPDLIRNAFSNPHFRRLVEGWREEVKKAGPAGADLSLDPWHRRMLVKVALGFTYRDHAGFVRAIARSAPAAKLKIDTMLKAFERGSGGIDWAEQLLSYAWTLIYGGLPEQRRDLEPMHINEFLKGAWFKGPNAPFIFTRRLLGLPRMKHWSQRDFGKRGDFDYQSDARFEAYKRVQNFLSGAPERPCLIVHSAVYQRGLNALAGKLVKDDREEAGFEALPRCLLYASAQAPPFKGVDLPFLINQIVAFYNAFQVERAPSVPDADVRRDIEFVRSLMARYPAVFIIDGVQDFGSDIPDLRAAMVDDPMRQLLSHLLYPDLWRADEPADPDIFHRNRFILLANGPCDWLGPMVEDVVELPPSSVIAARTYIQRDGIYRNPTKLKALFEKANHPRAAEEPILQCSDALISLDPALSVMPAPDDLADLLIERLVEKRPEWFLPLLLLILTPGGLRPQTIFRILAIWQGSQSADCPGHLDPRAFDPASLAEFQFAFHAIIVEAEDHTLMDAISRQVATTAGGVGSVRVTLNFVLPRTAHLLLGPMLGRIVPDDLSRLHVLLAEESMRQHTKLMRLVERDDHHSMRVNRRLLQAIFHGTMALDFSRERQGIGASSITAITQKERFSRIYAMFYRLLLEAPPHWEMSRVMAAAPIKRDLLLTMLAIHQPVMSRAHQISLSYDPPQWLLHDVATDRSIAVIAIDLYTALCKTTLQLNALDETEQALAAAEMILATTNSQFVDPEAADDILKISIDAAIVRDDLSLALREVRRGVGPRRFEDAFLSQARAATNAQSQTNPFPLRQMATSFSREEAARLVSLVQRWAEILVTSVDPPLETHSPRQSHRQARRLNDAHALFNFADALRWSAFVEHPFTRAFVPSGHSARVQVRVLILQSKRNSATPEDRRRLLELARRRVDTLTRSLARYPAERASMMILEGVLVLADDRSDAAVIAALGSLISADRQMLWAADRPRLRMRLLFERAKLLTSLAAADNRDAPLFARWARLDAERLKLLAERSGSGLWVRLAKSIRIPADSAALLLEPRKKQRRAEQGVRRKSISRASPDSTAPTGSPA